MTTAQAVANSTLLQRVIATLDIFPLSRASVIQRVMSMTTNVDTGITELSRAISTDSALTGKILRLSNSPFYGRMRKVSSLDQAIMILGFQTIRSLVVATSTATMFKTGDNQELQDSLWRHSLAVAVASRLTAQHFGPGLKEEAFVTGLMHDIAKPVLVQRFHDEYLPVLDELEKGVTDELSIEQEILGFTHSELGNHILEHWNFPSTLANAAGKHHDPETANPATEERPLAQIVCFANALAKSRGYGFLDESDVDVPSLPATEFLRLDEDTVTKLGEKLDSGFRDTVELFQS